jgi:V/A-type H+-transporting ATPase subunit E
MGRAELIAALYREKEKQALEIWRQAEAEAARLEAESQRTLERKRSEAEALRARRIADEQRPVLRAGERAARAIKSRARQELAGKLYQLATDRLDSIRERDEGLFGALAEELPRLQWQRVSVSPSDLERARQSFPGAQIRSDPEISGGMRVVDESGRIRVDNSLAKRLERGWPGILPGLIEAILKQEGRR